MAEGLGLAATAVAEAVVGGADECRLLVLMQYRMLWRLRRMRYRLLLLELSEADDHLE